MPDVQHHRAVVDHPAEEGRIGNRRRSDGDHLPAPLAGETGHVAGHVEVRQHHVRRVEVVAHDREDRVRDLVLVGRARDAHLEDVERFQPGSLSLRLREVVGVREGEAHVRGDVLEQLDVPIVESRLAIGLERKHGGDLLAAQHRNPDERARDQPPVGRRSGDEHRRAPADRPSLALEVLALKAARPWRAAHQHRLAGLVSLARRTRDRQSDRRHDLFDSRDVLITFGDRTVGSLGDGGENESIELHEGRELFAQGAHDGPLVKARGEAAPDRVDELEPSPLVLQRLVAPGVAQREGGLVRHELEESGGRVLVRKRSSAPDAKSSTHNASLFDRDPERRRRRVDQDRFRVAEHQARRGDRGRSHWKQPHRRG